MNISFHHKVAFGLIVLAAFLLVMWRYDFRLQEPRRTSVVTTLQTNLIQRDQLSQALHEIDSIRLNIERAATQGRVTNEIQSGLTESLNDLAVAADQYFPTRQEPFRQLESDTSEFVKISEQLVLYEAKLAEFEGSFKDYFQTFQDTVGRWKESAATAIAQGEPVSNTIPFSELSHRATTLERIIPEFSSFKQRLEALSVEFDQWINAINAAPTLEEKQAAFSAQASLLNRIPELFSSFNGYVDTAAKREHDNVKTIARQIGGSLDSIQSQVQTQYAVLNNSVQTIIAQNKYRDKQYLKVKYAVAVLTFGALILFFFAITAFAFRFEKGLAVFRRKTFEAAQATREVSASLIDNSTLAVDNFDLTQTLKGELTAVSDGFLARQNNLQHIDQLVRDTDALIKESQQNFTHIKEEFYHAEKASQEIVHLTDALEGVAQQMSLVAERVESNPAPTPQEITTIDELKYLSGRIRFAVTATHSTLDGRKEEIEEAKTKFTVIEENMTQMTENTRQALHGLALARLNNSEEVNRINEILENAKNKSRVIVSEIDALNKQINDFSVLSKHLAALHELAVKASALNAQSLLTNQSKAVAETITQSQRMNTYVQEYFKKVFENPALKPEQQVDPLAKPAASRIPTAAADV